eukprot:TRINITY_DN8567_c0_g1_i1.p1 TRINITY_DN8567_c0_g1~~TRINITY_DN8567_c0_g1_i1.p1  ORF type:complete len:1004 (+),score=237.04 TRINITY_DN8567_c0_g1_i1:92-3103(+)
MSRRRSRSADRGDDSTWFTQVFTDIQDMIVGSTCTSTGFGSGCSACMADSAESIEVGDVVLTPSYVEGEVSAVDPTRGLLPICVHSLDGEIRWYAEAKLQKMKLNPRRVCNLRVDIKRAVAKRQGGLGDEDGDGSDKAEAAANLEKATKKRTEVPGANGTVATVVSASGVGSPKTTPRLPTNGYKIKIDKGDGQKLGIDIDPKDGKTLVIEDIARDGLISAWNRQYPSQRVRIGDLILEINGVRGDSNRLVTAASQKRVLEMVLRRSPKSETENVMTYTVVINKTVGTRLGASVDRRDGEGLLIESITEGLFLAWSRANPTKRVEPGDRIMEVNGVKGDSFLLVSECEKNQVMHMTLARAIQETQQPEQSEQQQPSQSPAVGPVESGAGAASSTAGGSSEAPPASSSAKEPTPAESFTTEAKATSPGGSRPKKDEAQPHHALAGGGTPTSRAKRISVNSDDSNMGELTGLLFTAEEEDATAQQGEEESSAPGPLIKVFADAENTESARSEQAKDVSTNVAAASASTAAPAAGADFADFSSNTAAAAGGANFADFSSVAALSARSGAGESTAHEQDAAQVPAKPVAAAAPVQATAFSEDLLTGMTPRGKAAAVSPGAPSPSWDVEFSDFVASSAGDASGGPKPGDAAAGSVQQPAVPVSPAGAPSSVVAVATPATASSSEATPVRVAPAEAPEPTTPVVTTPVLTSPRPTTPVPTTPVPTTPVPTTPVQASPVAASPVASPEQGATSTSYMPDLWAKKEDPFAHLPLADSGNAGVAAESAPTSATAALETPGPTDVACVATPRASFLAQLVDAADEGGGGGNVATHEADPTVSPACTTSAVATATSATTPAVATLDMSTTPILEFAGVSAPSPKQSPKAGGPSPRACVAASDAAPLVDLWADCEQTEPVASAATESRDERPHEGDCTPGGGGYAGSPETTVAAVAISAPAPESTPEVATAAAEVAKAAPEAETAVPEAEKATLETVATDSVAETTEAVAATVTS